MLGKSSECVLRNLCGLRFTKRLGTFLRQAKDTAGGQWTRLDLNPDALLEEEGAVPDMHFDELLEGAGPLTVASKRVAEQDASHAVSCFEPQGSHALSQYHFKSVVCIESIVEGERSTPYLRGRGGVR